MNTPTTESFPEPELIARLKSQPIFHPFPGVEVIVLKERPLIKLMARLLRVWSALRKDVVKVKEMSLEGGCSCGSCAIYGGPAEGEGVPASYLLVEALATLGQLVKLEGIVVLGTPPHDPVARAFAEGVMHAIAQQCALDHPEAFAVELEIGA